MLKSTVGKYSDQMNQKASVSFLDEVEKQFHVIYIISSSSSVSFFI